MTILAAAKEEPQVTRSLTVLTAAQESSLSIMKGWAAI
jgi:hypothetical protein